MRQATHKATFRHHEVIEEVDDGMGGTVERRGWVDHTTDVPARHLPEGVGLEREEQGDRFREAQSLLVPARFVGTITADGGYDLTVGAGDDWRAVIHGLPGGERRHSVLGHKHIYGTNAINVPEEVYFELQKITE